MSDDFSKRSQAERQAVNSIIQGENLFVGYVLAKYHGQSRNGFRHYETGYGILAHEPAQLATRYDVALCNPSRINHDQMKGHVCSFKYMTSFYWSAQGLIKLLPS
jgi:hypothetical protein